MTEETDSLARVAGWVQSLYWTSSGTTFRVNPLTVLVFHVLTGRRLEPRRWPFVLLMVWGYLQFRLVSGYRAELGGGPGGVSRGLPDRLVTDGIYGLTRNPMYLGHLIYSLGLVLVSRTPVAALLALTRLVYFVRRVDLDEERLEAKFGDEYREYRRTVRRWIPGLI
jgi:protein-S-isoprenylcysteine O-methyltransferase Ste14